MSLTKQTKTDGGYFKNSVKLNLKRLDKPISHKVLFSALNVVLNQVENDAITKFNAAFNVAKIFDRDININGTIFRLEDANKVLDLRSHEFYIYDLNTMWVTPSDFENHRLETFFNAVRIDGLNIEHITEEKYKDRPKRKNGVRRVHFQKKLRTLLEAFQAPQ
ncbi:hypothetical protein BpHYR1_028664 [Brachionus plicatilis]|uniref:Uncharacterized protein n=1 Tax=Brachionus plicatilis TaxID=10195 RepID=A0A3M7P9X7_BRAPC|nr:hypothetical protein BpHYR1_028664 [Brachionus plicatilis]